MKKILPLIIFLFSINAFSQFLKLDGVIELDSADATVGKFIIFSRADSTLIKGSYIDSVYFSTEFEPKGISEFYVKISILGYKDTIINFDVSAAIISLGNIKMQNDRTLNTVNIVYVKPEFERTMDGIKVNVQGTTLQTLSTLFDVLIASPKLSSPDGESIEIIGKGVPLILIDRQAIISNDELKAIPANMIESIEIITNPSAKYRAQGSGNGVIEVYTKNFNLEGYNATINTSGGINTQLKPTGNLNLGISLKRKKISLNGYLGANYSESNSFSFSDGTALDDSHQTINSSTTSENWNSWQFYQLKSAYRISTNQKITMGLRGNGGLGGNEITSSTNYATNDSISTSKISLSDPKYNSFNNTAFLNYAWETDTNKSVFEINLNFVQKWSTNSGTSLSTYQNLPLNIFSDYNIKNESRDRPLIGELRINYEHVFDTSGWKLSVGGTYSLLKNGKIYNQYNLENSDWIADSLYTNSYDYEEQIGALFFEISKKWKKIGMRAGIRGEYTGLNGYSNSLNKQFMDSTYILPFPSASILLEPNDKIAMTFSYSSGIQRPQFSNYDPFVRIQDSLSISYGNPYLRPKTSHSFGFDLDLFYAYNFSVTYTQSKNPQSDLIFIDNTTFLWNSTPWNAESDQKLTASFNLPIQLKWLQGWNSFWTSYNKYTFTPEYNREPFYNLTYGFYSYLTFILPKDWSLMNTIHLMKWGSANFIGNTQVNWGLRLTKKMFKNNFQIFLEVSNIFPPKSNYTRYFSNYQYEDRSQNQFTSFKLGLFYKFGRLKQAANIKESNSGQSDRL